MTMGIDEQSHGGEGVQILKTFRTVVKSNVELFRAQRNHVHELLGGHHNYASGTFREGLLRTFLAAVLPRSVSIDSGFIYGFDQIENSKQIDILVWDSSRHSCVFRAGDFVIVSPESVIAALSVKSTLGRSELRDALDNLQSVVPLDEAYRGAANADTGGVMHGPIIKIVIAYESSAPAASLLSTAREYYENIFSTNVGYGKSIRKVLTDMDPFHPPPSHADAAGRFLPTMIAAIETNEMSLYRGWGPPDDPTASRTYGRGLKRLPYMYFQDSKLTTPLEKVVFHVLRATYTALGTVGRSLVAAWGEFNPVHGYRDLVMPMR